MVEERDFSQFFVAYRSDIINVVGIIIGLIGFGITIWGVLRSKRAAEAAEQASLQTQKELKYLDTVMDFSAAITMMEEIKRHHRTNNWDILPDRYSILRQKLIAIKGNNSHASDSQLTIIQSAIQAFKDMESSVGRMLIRKTTTITKVNKFNDAVNEHMDALNEVLMEIKNKLDVN